MLRSKTNQWGPVRQNMREKGKSLLGKNQMKKRAELLPASILQYRGNVDLSGFIGSWGGNLHKYGRRPIERECRVVQRSLEEGD